MSAYERENGLWGDDCFEEVSDTNAYNKYYL